MAFSLESGRGIGFVASQETLKNLEQQYNKTQSLLDEKIRLAHMQVEVAERQKASMSSSLASSAHQAETSDDMAKLSVEEILQEIEVLKRQKERELQVLSSSILARS